MSPVIRIFAVLSLLWLAGCGTGGRPPAAEPVLAEPVVLPPIRPDTLPLVPNNPPPQVRTPSALNITPPAPALATVPAPTPVKPNSQPMRGYAPARIAERYALSQTWIPLKDWCDANNFGDFSRTPAPDGALYSFTVPEGTVVLQTGSQAVNWCGVTLYLGWAPQLINGKPFLTALDIRKNFEPLLGMAPMQTHGSVIVLDAGHGGSDNGTRSVFNGHSEKEYTLDMVYRLQTLLSAQGWKVFLTRTGDSALKLPDRVAVADAHRADVFLSIHFNSDYPQTTESGLETYCLPAKGMPSNLSRFGSEQVALPLPNNLFDSENIVLAERIHRELLKVNGHLDRGVRRARFLGVLKSQERPAVLVECGYLSNPAESRKIADPAYRQRMAEAIASALKPELPARQFAEAPAGLASSVTAPASSAEPSPVAAKPVLQGKRH